MHIPILRSGCEHLTLHPCMSFTNKRSPEGVRDEASDVYVTMWAKLMRSTPHKQFAQEPAGDQVGHLWWRMLNGELPAVNYPGIVVILIGAHERAVRCPGLEAVGCACTLQHWLPTLNLSLIICCEKRAVGRGHDLFFQPVLQRNDFASHILVQESSAWQSTCGIIVVILTRLFSPPVQATWL